MAIQTSYGRMRRGVPGQVIGTNHKTGPLISGPLSENDLGKAISLIDELHRPAVRSDDILAVDRSFVGILSRASSGSHPAIMIDGKVYVETEKSVKRADRVLVSASNGLFTTGTPSKEYPELLNASYMDNSDESNLVTLELYFADYIYRIIEHYLKLT